MKKILKIFYIALCMAICLVPFAGMTFWATDSTVENKTLASFPSLIEDGSLNIDFLEELGTYFEDHFAFREALVNADALIMANVFQESNEDTIVLGTDGWLYYSATVDDYLGQNLLSERSIYNASHNLKLMQDYVEDSGAQFVVAVAPNKNSLYGDNMPYYDSVIVSDASNWENLKAQMEALGVSYADWFELFENQDEVLYLRRDSHWNNKGALLAYSNLMEILSLPFDNYETVSVTRTKTEIGDLGTMIFPLTAEPEWNYYYEKEAEYTYVTDTESVEDSWIITKNASEDGSLLMFRDSFGNTLLPFFANAFGDAYFSRGEPYAIGRYLDSYSPDVVIVERVERSISDFAEIPPMMQTLAVSSTLGASAAASEGDGGTADTASAVATDTEAAVATDTEAAAGTETEIEAAAAAEAGTCVISESSDVLYYQISGVLDESGCGVQTEIYIRLTCGENTVLFPAFYVTSDATDYGYLFYLEKDYAGRMTGNGENTIRVEVLTENDGVWEIAAEAELTV